MAVSGQNKGLLFFAKSLDKQCGIISPKLRSDAAEAAMIRDLASEQTNRDRFDSLQEHQNRLAEEVGQAMKEKS